MVIENIENMPASKTKLSMAEDELVYDAGRQFDFSVIVPVYNVEQYLEEAIDSIIEQTVGFYEHIQLILVNDGSVDGSARICKEYLKEYPDNIIFIDKANEGVSIARNTGLKKATGKYINFFDSDDKWSKDAFECAASFFINHPEIKIATARHTFFGKRSGNHPLSYKYEVDQIIDIEKTYDYPHLSFSNAFVERSLLHENIFDKRLKISEDFVIINTILLKMKRYAVLSEPVYWYRKREDISSAIDTSVQEVTWYEDTPRLCYQSLFDISKKLYGRVIPYIQYCVMYDLQWRIKNPIDHPLDSGQLARYKKLIITLLTSIQDEIVLEQKNIYVETKLYILALKHSISMQDIQRKLHIINNDTYLLNEEKYTYIRSAAKANKIKLLSIEQTDGEHFYLEGMLHTILPAEKVRLMVTTKDRTYEARIAEHYGRGTSSFFEDGFFRHLTFNIRLPYKTAHFKLVLDAHAYTPAIVSGKFFPLSCKKNSWCSVGDYVLTYPAHGTLQVQKKSTWWKIKREVLYESLLWLNEKSSRSYLKYRRSAIGYNLRTHKKKIWLICDRPTMAGDNGEALFSYLMKNPLPHVDVYFVLNADSPDWERLKKIGPVVAFNSERHKRLALRADKLISSAAEDMITNRFDKKEILFRDVRNGEFVFLQHGIIMEDLSWWLNKFNKNISLFVTANQKEYESIINTPSYYYTASVVKLTGLPRHDKLRLHIGEPTHKKVLVMPTWRRYLTGVADKSSGERTENPAFPNSAYYKFYQSLINDRRLQEATERLGFTVDFLLHPSFLQELPKFHSSFCNIVTEYNYSQEFIDSAIAVTDYSSAIFDFALMKKPLLYSQFDTSEYYKKHMDKGDFFDFEDDGFGPVCYTYEDTVDQLIAYLENPVMQQKYQDRVERFFYTPKTSSCKEVVDAILALDHPSENN